ncbi:MAG TPA: M28 family peptidase [bacterium]|nr:M28 family peptidase [bacterium]
MAIIFQVSLLAFAYEWQATAISADSIKKHVYILGHDSLQGRGTGTIGGAKAAQYIAGQLAKIGLRPIGDQKTYFQSIPMHGSYALPGSRLIFHLNDSTHVLQINKNYLLYKTGAQTLIPQPTPLVFVGYGIIAPEFDYNDYQSIDVEGKIVIFLSGEPPSDDPAYFNGPYPTIYSYPESKQRIAISRGAKGSILIPSPRNEPAFSWERYVREFSLEDVTLAYSISANLSLIINPKVAEKLFRDTNVNLEAIFKQDSESKLSSFDLPGKISFHGKFVEREFFAANVVAMLPGKNKQPDDSYLLISAHYDHLGIGPAVAGDSIYNGVFDNAVGVAGVIEIARAFVKHDRKPLHSVIFFFPTAEEKGVLGSTYYTDHPIVPLYKTLAAINVDGLSMFDKFTEIVGIGAEYSSLGDQLQGLAQRLGLNCAPIPAAFISSETYARSDQIAFAKAGIPAIAIAEGIGKAILSREESMQKLIDWMNNIYHTPFDDLNQPMNFEAAKQHCEVIFYFCQQLANLEEFPQWKSGVPFINARLQSIAEKR